MYRVDVAILFQSRCFIPFYGAGLISTRKTSSTIIKIKCSHKVIAYWGHQPTLYINFYYFIFHIKALRGFFLATMLGNCTCPIQRGLACGTTDGDICLAFCVYGVMRGHNAKLKNTLKQYSP